MKGGIVLTLSALKAFNTTGALDSANITVFLGGDEESPAEPVEVSRKELLDAGKSSEAAQVGFLDKSITLLRSRQCTR
jgi:glutamate carboxypeptidase